MMYWSSLDEYCSTSSSDSEEFLDTIGSNQDYGDFQKNPVRKDDTFSEERLVCEDDQILCQAEQNFSPVVQEPVSENDLTECLRMDDRMQSVLIRKDEYISNLKKLLSCQREQLYFFLKMSINENTLAPLKYTCQETDTLYDNENLSMALDRFRHKNNFPSEQTLLREDILKTLMRLERLIKSQEKLSKSIEKDFLQTSLKDQTYVIESYQDIFENKLLSGTQQLFQSVESLRIQLKRIGLIEDERIHLIERVYSLPSSQRQYYTHLMMLEREKIRMREEIQELKEKRNTLKETTQILQEATESKIADFDLNQIKPGLETHVKIMEMVEKGELSLVTMTNDEKGRFKNEYSRLCAENTDLTMRLKDFDKAVLERDDLRKQVNVLVENCLQKENEIRRLRKNNRTEELLNELKESSIHKDQMRMQLDKIVKDGPAVLRVCGESITKIVDERDQLRLKLTEYLSMEEDIKLLKLRASQAETHRREAEKLKASVSELEEIKASYMAFVDRNGQNLDLVSPSDREKYRNMCKELNYLKQVEVQKESLVAENLVYRQTLDKQEIEIKELLEIVDRLNLNLKTYKADQKIPMDGLPEGPNMRNFLSQEEKNKVEKIRERILDATQKPPKIKIQVLRNPSGNSGGLSILLDMLKYLGFFLRRGKFSNV